MAIGDLKTRLRARFTRRYSAASTLSQSSTDGVEAPTPPPVTPSTTGNRKTRSVKSKKSIRPASIKSLFGAGGKGESIEVKANEKGAGLSSEAAFGLGAGAGAGAGPERELKQQACSDQHETPATTILHLEDQKHDSSSTADFPTPNTDIAPVLEENEDEEENVDSLTSKENIHFATPDFQSPPHSSTSSTQRPAELIRKQSIVPHGQTQLIKTLLETELPPPSAAANLDYFTNNGPSTITANMVSRKIWVKRPGASATLVTIQEDFLVDDVREMILRKYANSLGRSFDAPDVVLRIMPKNPDQPERLLRPDEEMAPILDLCFPGGQGVDDALIIDVPTKRTPRPSPQPQQHRTYYDELRPTEAGTDYFPIMPPAQQHSPHISGVPPANGHIALPPHSMSVINTGQLPPLPSPGGSSRRHGGGHRRPGMGRTTTASPTIMSATPGINNEKSTAPPTAPPLPSPTPVTALDMASQIQRTATPPARVSSPRPVPRAKKNKKTTDHPSLPSGMLNGGVPPINVLIVEDNIINLKLLEAFMKRLKVRWQTAMNGREAVTKWRAGGFHLVLMDIQLPIMSGLEATKEIRRLERLNSIGVFSSSASSNAPEQGPGEPEGQDKLPSSVLFKSPVIIVALTASSLQSDRHEALAAGCNDFLTKPVNFVWLERKVMEWGCMQALIDFDGWRKWKDFSQQTENDKEKTSKSLAASKKKKANRTSVGSNPGGSTVRLPIKEENEGTVAVA